MATLSTGNRVVLMTLYSVMVVFGTFGNSCVLFSLISSKANRRKIQNIYVWTLSTVDILYCLIYPPYILLSLIDPKITIQHEMSCKIMIVLSYTLSMAGLIAITTLSLDRYFAVRYPFAYHGYTQSHSIFLVSLLVYIYPFACFCPLLAAKDWAQCIGELGIPSGVIWQKLPVTYVCFIALLGFIVPGVVLIFTNIYVFVIARKQYTKSQKSQVQKVSVSSFQTTFEANIGSCVMYSNHMAQDPTEVSNIKHKTSISKSKIVDINGTISVEKTPPKKDTHTSIIHCKESTGISNKITNGAIKVLNASESIHRIESKTSACVETFSVGNVVCSQEGDVSDIYNNVFTDGGEQSSRSSTLREEQDFRKAKKHVKQRKMQQDRKMALMTFSLVIGFFITWLPFSVSRLSAVFNKSSPASKLDLYAAAFTTVNSVINPYLVIATRKDIRQVFLRKKKTYQFSEF